MDNNNQNNNYNKTLKTSQDKAVINLTPTILVLYLMNSTLQTQNDY